MTQVLEIFATALASTRDNVWGWLEPGSGALPHVLLKGNELALGRGSGGVPGAQEREQQHGQTLGSAAYEGQGLLDVPDQASVAARWAPAVTL